MYWKWAWRREQVVRVQSASGMTGLAMRPIVKFLCYLAEWRVWCGFEGIETWGR